MRKNEVAAQRNSLRNEQPNSRLDRSGPSPRSFGRKSSPAKKRNARSEKPRIAPATRPTMHGEKRKNRLVGKRNPRRNFVRTSSNENVASRKTRPPKRRSKPVKKRNDV